MRHIPEYLPSRVNSGPFITAYTLNALSQRIGAEPLVLPVCSIGTPVRDLANLAPHLLPPLNHEALDLDPGLKEELIERIRQCFPYFQGTRKRAEFRGQLEVVEHPHRSPQPVKSPRIVAFSVDTAVEQHGPHLPLATDTIQSYAVLRQLEREVDGLSLTAPLDYGQLTWGLPFGFSIDTTAPLLTRYVTGYVNALQQWIEPEAIYVVDVHGSQVHRDAIVRGLQASHCPRWAFRWLHEPLAEFTSQRGDQHAGGVETALVHFIDPQLVDSDWWPGRVAELAAGQMPMQTAVDLSQDLPKFIQHVESGRWNGIVGDIPNFFAVDAADLFQRMLAVARADLAELANGSPAS